MFGLFAKKSGSAVFVADIGSGSVGCAIAEVSGAQPALVVASERVALAIEKRSEEATVAALSQALAEAGKRVLEKYHARHPGKAITAVQVILRAPWCTSKSARASAQYENERVITHQHISELAQQGTRTIPGADSGVAAEISVVRVELNGYPTASPEGKRAHTLSVVAFASACHPGLRRAVESALGALMPHVQVAFRSGTRALLAVFREHLNESDHLIIDFGTEATEIIVVRDGVLAGETVVPEGVATALHRVSPAGLPEETMTLMRMLAKDQCDSDACDTLLTSMAKCEPELVPLFGEAFSSLASAARLPNTCMLLAHVDVAPWLVKFFSRIDFSQFTQTAQPFAVSTLSTGELSRFAHGEAGVSLDADLAVAVSLVHIEYGS